MTTNAPVETKPAETKPAEPQQTHAIGEFKHTSPLLSCRFDPSGQFVFATAYDNTIQRWQLSSGKATPLALATLPAMNMVAMSSAAISRRPSAKTGRWRVSTGPL